MKRIFVTLALFLLYSGAFAQGQASTAPVKWERYKNSDKHFSALFPKLPIVIKSGDYCSEVERHTYAAYADGMIYTLVVFSKKKESLEGNCTAKTVFDRSVFDNRLHTIRNMDQGSKESKSTHGQHNVIQIVADYDSHWVYSDLKNNRWYELSIRHRKGITPQTQFLESLEIGKRPAGLEIDDGSPTTLGDEGAIDTSTAKPTPTGATPTSHGMAIGHKPRPGYTAKARENMVQGTVVVKVTFLANGSIGNISVVKALPHGLTEQAVAAAKRIVFIPKRVGEINVAVIRNVEYSFSIY